MLEQGKNFRNLTILHVMKEFLVCDELSNLLLLPQEYGIQTYRSVTTWYLVAVTIHFNVILSLLWYEPYDYYSV
jgi:hypothetical protein